MTRHHAPVLVAARPDAGIAIVSGDRVSVHEHTKARAERDDEHIGRDESPLQLGRLVRGKANGPTPMEGEIVRFRRQRTIRSDKEQRIVDESIERVDIAVELRLPQRRFQLFDELLMHDRSDVVNGRLVWRATSLVRAF